MCFTLVASRGFYIFKNTIWENIKMIEEISVRIETNNASKKIDPYCCAIKALVSGNLESVGQTPREVSRYFFFFIGEEGDPVDGFCVVNTLPSLAHP